MSLVVFSERQAIIPVFKMPKTKSQSALLQLRDVFNIPAPCHVDDAGAIIFPVSSVMSTNHYTVYSAQLAHNYAQGISNLVAADGDVTIQLDK